ncbi:MAG: 2-hydroxyacyl-CoA dehydratase family protein [Deltaproteobacteria bacterium]|nr:2-hydroxyacyl-CoA dehydratase family protein [Deltaproteobacteria bacterium]
MDKRDSRPASTRGLKTRICKAYTCDIIRNGLSFLLSGGLDETDLVVVPHGCDSLQGLGSVRLDFVKRKQPVLTLYLPRRDESDTEKAIRFFADEFRPVGVNLEAIATSALARRTQTPRTGTPVAVSGIIPEPTEFLDALNRAGVEWLLQDLNDRPRNTSRPAGAASR